MNSYELVYSMGGHGGPYWGETSAIQWAIRLLRGSATERAIYLVPRTAIEYSPSHATIKVVKRTSNITGEDYLMVLSCPNEIMMQLIPQ